MLIWKGNAAGLVVRSWPLVAAALLVVAIGYVVLADRAPTSDPSLVQGPFSSIEEAEWVCGKDNIDPWSRGASSYRCVKPVRNR